MKKKIEKYHVENKEEAKKQTLKRNPSFFCVCVCLFPDDERTGQKKSTHTHNGRTKMTGYPSDAYVIIRYLFFPSINTRREVRVSRPDIRSILLS